MVATTLGESGTSCSASIKKMQLHGFEFETCTELLQDEVANKFEKEFDVDCFIIDQKSALQIS